MSVPKWKIIEDNLGNIGKWIEDGLFEYQIIKRLGISKPTWEKYKKESEQLREVLYNSRNVRNANLIPELENALLKVALGYTDPKAIVEEVSELKEDGTMVVRKKVVSKTYPPDTAAAHICLKNFSRPFGTRWTDNPEGDELKRKRLEMEKQMMEARLNGWTS